MKFVRLTVLLYLSWTPLFAQNIQITEHQARAILKDRAELKMLRVRVVLDSVANAALFNAYYYRDSALQDSIRAREEADQIAQDYHSLYNVADNQLGQARKEVRKQKVVKWVAIGAASLIAILAMK